MDTSPRIADPAHLADTFVATVTRVQQLLETLPTPALHGLFGKQLAKFAERLQQLTTKNPIEAARLLVDHLPFLIANALIERLQQDASKWRNVLALVEGLPADDRIRLLKAIEKGKGGAVTAATFDQVCEQLVSQIEELQQVNEDNLEAAYSELRRALKSRAGEKQKPTRRRLLILANASNKRGNSYADILDVINKQAKRWKLETYASGKVLKEMVSKEKRKDPALFNEEVSKVLAIWAATPTSGEVAE